MCLSVLRWLRLIGLYRELFLAPHDRLCRLSLFSCDILRFLVDSQRSQSAVQYKLLRLQNLSKKRYNQDGISVAYICQIRRRIKISDTKNFTRVLCVTNIRNHTILWLPVRTYWCVELLYFQTVKCANQWLAGKGDIFVIVRPNTNRYFTEQ